MVETIQPNDVAEVVVQPVPATPVVPPTPAELMQKIAAAGASGDLAEVIKLGNQLKKHQSDIQAAEMAKLKAEAEAMAGGRERLATELLKLVKGIDDIKPKLEAVKATGFTFKLAFLDGQGVEVKPAVALTVPTIKAAKSGGGGGSTGALKTQTGLARHELIDTYATDAEKEAIASAEAGATNRPDSARYVAEKPVIKRILADNPNLIKH